jgi:hypothetical protein
MYSKPQQKGMRAGGGGEGGIDRTGI